MKHQVIRKQPNSKMCLVCGKKNDLSLNAEFFELDDGSLVAQFKPLEEHQSYPGRLHGGVAAAILDETIGRAVMVGAESEVWGVTLEFKIRYRKPIPLDQKLRVVARITRDSDRFFEGSGEVLLVDGKVAASGEGKYLKLPIEKISDFDIQEQEWGVIHSLDDPEEIEI